MHKVGIALSGGGTRGVVHIGVLKALEENGIYPTIISGTSAGSIVGVMYAQGFTPAQIFEIAGQRSLLWMFSLMLPTRGFVRHTFLRKMLQRYVTAKDFEELKKPLYIAMANLNTGKPEIRHEGPLHDVIIASCSIPVLYEPIRFGDHWCVDGGLLMNLPVSPIRPLAHYIIAVNLIPRIELAAQEVNTLSGIAARSFSLATINTTEPEIKYADKLIEPVEIHQFNKFSFSNLKEMHEIGYQETLKHIPDIKEEIEKITELRDIG